jgi:hypothetical protein
MNFQAETVVEGDTLEWSQDQGALRNFVNVQ